MKKTFILLITSGFLISCGKGKAVSDIEDYVAQINSRPDLTESISEYKAEDLRTDLMSQLVMEQLKDSSGKVYRINAEFFAKG